MLSYHSHRETFSFTIKILSVVILAKRQRPKKEGDIIKVKMFL